MQPGFRDMLTGEDASPIKQYAGDGLHTNFEKNYKYLSKNRGKLDELFAAK